MQLVIAPDLAGLGDVAGFGGIDATQNSDAFAVFRVLTHGNIDPVLVKDRCGIDFAGSFRRWIFKFFAIGRIAIVLPGGFQEAGVAFLDWLRIEGIAKTIKIGRASWRERV